MIEIKKFTLAGMIDFNTIQYSLTPKVKLTSLDQIKLYDGDRLIPISSVTNMNVTATTGNIKVINVPEGMEYDLMNDVMKVVLRGTNSQMNTLDPENIEVTVDLTGKELGASTIKATVIVKGDGYETVGPVGTHSVSVTLREEEDS